ncbi:MAG: SdiA-regulated domain-containing protein [Spirochaetes bacterium]|nr:SdiA-regulated domain-containing protein [Spirochaetota bacterium]
MDNYLFAYDVENPDAKYKLPSYLEEISGLSYYGQGKIACVQDEKAHIYILNLEQEKIIKKYDFGDDADYEDIAIVDKTAYILRSNGHIYRIKDFKKKDRKVKKYNTALKEKIDTEVIAYDPLSNALLIACKGSPSIEKENLYKGYKAIYKFDLEEEELVRTPHFLVDLERLDSYVDRNVFSKLSLKVAKKLHLIESETSFQPSGIAIHPLHGEIYIISSVGKLLIILNRRGKVLDVKELDPKIFRQPEGICFSPTGDMFISSEGQGGKGYILKFNFHEDR